MKKLVYLLLAVCMVFALTACNAAKPTAEVQKPQETPAQPEQEVEVTEDSNSVAVSDYVADDGQNPVMNFIGNYQCDRARAHIECSGNDSALITIDWGGSASELARWVIIGRLDTDTLTIDYSGCRKSILTYADGGDLVSEKVEYEDGTGKIIFNDNGTFTWHEDQSEYGKDMVFDWLPVTGGDEPAVQLANPWRDITEAEAKELCPKSFAAPEGAQNIQWRVLDSAADPSGIPGALVQLTFDLDGNSYTAREQVTGDPEADLSGMYYDWMYHMDETLKNWADTACHTYRFIGEDEYADLCTWYDAETGISYSLGVTAKDLDGFDLLAIAEAIHG